MFCSSDIGWVLGHSFIIYAPLITGIKSVLFEGKPVGTPNPDVFWQIIDRNKSSAYLIQFSIYTPHPPPSEASEKKIQRVNISISTIYPISKASLWWDNAATSLLSNGWKTTSRENWSMIATGRPKVAVPFFPTTQDSRPFLKNQALRASLSLATT